jgi:hypothetical protein
VRPVYWDESHFLIIPEGDGDYNGCWDIGKTSLHDMAKPQKQKWQNVRLVTGHKNFKDKNMLII